MEAARLAFIDALSEGQRDRPRLLLRFLCCLVSANVLQPGPVVQLLTMAVDRATQAAETCKALGALLGLRCLLGCVVQQGFSRHTRVVHNFHKSNGKVHSLSLRTLCKDLFGCGRTGCCLGCQCYALNSECHCRNITGKLPQAMLSQSAKCHAVR